MQVVRVPVGKSKRRNGGHAVRAPCSAFGRAALKSSDFDASIVLVVADQAVLGLCSEPRSSGGLVRSGEAKYRGAWHAGARAPGLRCWGCRGVFRGGRSSCHGPDRRKSRASGRKGNIVLGGDQRAGSLSASGIEESGFRHFQSVGYLRSSSDRHLTYFTHYRFTAVVEKILACLLVPMSKHLPQTAHTQLTPGLYLPKCRKGQFGPHGVWRFSFSETALPLLCLVAPPSHLYTEKCVAAAG